MQQPKRFQAPTLAEAYEQVRRDLGESAVILSTRKAFAPGLFGQPGRQFVEVVARVPESSPARRAVASDVEEALLDEARPTLEQDQAAHDLVRAVAEATASAPASASGPFAGFQRVAALDDLPVPIEQPAPSMAAPSAGGSDALAGTDSAIGQPWSRQLDQMRSMLEQLVSDRMEARLESGPVALREAQERLVRHGMSSALAATLLAETELTGEDEAAVLAAVERRLAAKLPPVVSVNLARRRAVFLVGPSGAGKTTMAVRLALQLQREGMNVVIAGTDVNRAGAPQQLLAFGAVTGIEVRLCYAPEELAEVVADPEVDAVIVDTPGHNGLRRDRMAELESFLQVARQRNVLLTVPATMKHSDLGDLVAAYSGAGVDGLVLTRCDETQHVGSLASVALEAAIGVAYTTHSDQVSDAPVLGDNATFAAAAVRSQWEAAPVLTPAKPRAASSRRRLAKVG